MTNWTAFAIGLSFELGVARWLHMLLTEPERLNRESRQDRSLARGNLEAEHLLPPLAELFRTADEFRGEAGGSYDAALSAVGYSDALDDLTAGYSDYVRLERLPVLIRQAALALVAVLVVFGLSTGALFLEAFVSADQIGSGLQRLVVGMSVASGTLVVAGAVYYYCRRHTLAALIDRYG